MNKDIWYLGGGVILLVIWLSIPGETKTPIVDDLESVVKTEVTPEPPADPDPVAPPAPIPPAVEPPSEPPETAVVEPEQAAPEAVQFIPQRQIYRQPVRRRWRPFQNLRNLKQRRR